MEVIVSASQLKQQVGNLQGILARKETIPILSRIKIVVSDDGDLIMTATDLDVSLVTRQEVDVLQSGSICLSGKKLGQITGALPNEPVHLKLDYMSERVEFLAGSFKCKLAGVDDDQFPEIRRVTGESVKISATVFYEGLRRTVFAVTENDSRFTINGFCFWLKKENLKWSAPTDIGFVFLE